MGKPVHSFPSLTHRDSTVAEGLIQRQRKSGSITNVSDADRGRGSPGTPQIRREHSGTNTHRHQSITSKRFSFSINWSNFVIIPTACVPKWKSVKDRICLLIQSPWSGLPRPELSPTGRGDEGFHAARRTLGPHSRPGSWQRASEHFLRPRLSPPFSELQLLTYLGCVGLNKVLRTIKSFLRRMGSRVSSPQATIKGRGQAPAPPHRARAAE